MVVSNMLNGFVYDVYDANNERWDLNIDGFIFHCTYTPADDWIEVYCPQLSNMPKGTEAKKINYHTIAHFLASQILRESGLLSA